ncbi:COG4280 domain-containing protein [Frondihabitans sp. PAMC 28766]|uniref:COG4280 domain-containing protein n=1 Tax=Frondihabitans sp. PAMC 28766 TaxID=1795630 RepID=UPI000AFC5444|nr:TMEM165/GDT1 family protein [Frondihabitans sp. PAMC 28766]
MNLTDPQNIALFFSVLIACIVEAVEATTIVLAAGTSRHWRSAAQGVIAGLIVLAVVIAVAGPAIQILPLNVLRLVVGGLLLIFGLQWLRKAINRSSGYRPLHDEAAIYQKQVTAARAAANTSKFFVNDWYAFTLSFKGVVLEGLEVVFIVLTFGTNQHNVPLAAVAAGAAVVIVAILGFVVRGPLSRVPENTMKFVVGILLASFGIFWGGEGAGAAWPGADISLLVVAPSVAVFCLILVFGMRAYRLSHVSSPVGVSPDLSQSGAPSAGPRFGAAAGSAAVSVAGGVATMAPAAAPALSTETSAAPASAMILPPRPHGLSRRLAAVGLFLYDFVIGDDWQIAAGIAVGLIVTTALAPMWGAAFIVMPVFAAALLPYSIRRSLR